MLLKSINIIFIFAISASLSACYQDLVDTSYKSDTPGYFSPKISKNATGAEPNKYVNANSKFRTQNPNQVPVILNDPFAAGISQSLQNASSFQPTFSGYTAPSNAYGSFTNSENGIIRGNVLIENSAPIYPQPNFGSNIYSPYRR